MKVGGGARGAHHVARVKGAATNDDRHTTSADDTKVTPRRLCMPSAGGRTQHWRRCDAGRQRQGGVHARLRRSGRGNGIRHDHDDRRRSRHGGVTNQAWPDPRGSGGDSVEGHMGEAAEPKVGTSWIGVQCTAQIGMAAVTATTPRRRP